MRLPSLIRSSSAARRLDARGGFSLIQMAVVLAVAGILAAALLPGGQNNSTLAKQQISYDKLLKIEQASLGFMAANGRRPCPANATLATSHAQFGQELATPGTCTGANITGTGASINVLAGGVPTRALGLSDDYAVDGFGRRFTYVVDKRATQAASCAGTSSGDITVVNAADAGDTLAQNVVDYISYGANPQGAFSQQGVRMTATSTEPDVLANALSNTAKINTLVRRESSGNFTSAPWASAISGNKCCTGPGCATAAGCVLPWGGITAEGTSVTAYLNGTEAYGGSCTSETRSCAISGGVLTLSGSYTKQSCTVPGGSCTLPWGGTIRHGNSVSAYSAGQSGSCPAANTLSCTNGALACSSGILGDCQYATCSGGGGCPLPWGGKVDDTRSVTAYQTGSVANGQTCTSETRNCSGTTLSGSYTFRDCTPDGASCALPWGGTVADTASVTAFENGTVASPGVCVSESRSCANGTLSGSFSNLSCAVTGKCNLPWGGTIASGASVTAYQAAVGSPSCVSQSRSCSNGTLSGGYAYQSCSPGAPGASCALPWGGNITNGATVTAYQYDSSGTCVSEARSCSGGVLSGGYRKQNCTFEPDSLASVKLWLDASDATTVMLSYNSMSTTANGSSGANTISVGSVTGLSVGARIQLGGGTHSYLANVTQSTDNASHIYTIDAIFGTTLLVSPSLTQAYSSTTLYQGYVGQIADKSGNGKNATQATAAYQPLWLSNGQNGKGIARFDGTNDKLTSATPAATNTDNFSFTTVFNASSSKTTQEVVFTNGYDNGGGIGNGATFVLNLSTPLDLYGLNSNVAYWTSGTTYQADKANIVSFNRTTTSSIFLNGTQAPGTNNAGIYTPTAFTLGGDGGTLLRSFKGDINEVAYYGATLAAINRQSLETYESTKWGVSATDPSSIAGLKLWLDASDMSKVLLSYNSMSTTATGSIGGNTVTVGSSAGLAVGARIKLGGANSLYLASHTQADDATSHIYTIDAISGTTLVVNPPLTQAYSGVALYQGYAARVMDKSGNGLDTVQTTASAMPLWISNDRNGKGVLSFTPSGSMDSSTISNPGKAESAFAVFNSLVAAGDHRIFFTPNHVNIGSLNSLFEIVHDGVAHGSDSNVATGSGQFFNMSAITTAAGASSLYIQSSTAANSTNNNAITSSPANKFRLGHSGYTGKIGEVIDYFAEFSPADRAKIENYQSTKWGIDPNDPTTIPGLKLWLDASDAEKVQLSYNSMSTTASGSSGASSITVGSSTGLAVGARIKLGGSGGVYLASKTQASDPTSDIYTIDAISGTTLTISPALTQAYSGAALYQGYVTRMIDKSGNGADFLQTDATRMPLWHRSSSFNNKPVMDFVRTPGNEDYLELNNGNTGYAALNNQVNNGNYWLQATSLTHSGGADNSAEALQSILMREGYHIGLLYGGYPSNTVVGVGQWNNPQNTNISPGLALGPNTPSIIGGGTSGGGSNYGVVSALNGMLSATSAIDSVQQNTQAYRIGVARQTGADYHWYLDGEIGEVFAYATLTTADRQKLEQYQGNKWGIDLPIYPPNYSFETPYVATYGNPAGASWTSSSNMIARNGSGYNNANAPDGAQVGVLQTTNVISQPLTLPAGFYRVKFKAAYRNAQDGVNDFTVSLGGTVIGGFYPSTYATYNTYITDGVTLLAGTHTLSFNGLRSQGGDRTSFIDDVQLIPTACSTPWGDGVANGASFTAYQAPGSAGACVSETRVCTGGALSGSYTHQGCVPSSGGVYVGEAGFENPPTTAIGPGPGPYWSTAAGSNFNIAANNSAYNNGTAPVGSQVGVLQQTNVAAQTITDWPAGTYRIVFKAKGRVDGVGANDIAVKVDGSTISTFTPSTSAYADYTTATFVVSAGTHTLTFQGLNTGGSDHVSFIDDVRITP